MPCGNLLASLRSSHSSEDAFSLSQLLLFAQDTAKGMVHLASHGIVHRDLAGMFFLKK